MLGGFNRGLKNIFRRSMTVIINEFAHKKEKHK